VTTNGTIRLTDDLDGAVGVDVINTLTVTSGTTGIYKDHTNMTATQVDEGAELALDASGGAIAYNGTVAMNGLMTVQGGAVNMPTVITSTASPLVNADGLKLEYYLDGLSADGDCNRDKILLDLGGAGFDKYSPGGAQYNATNYAYAYGVGADLDLPGNANTTNDNPFVDADGNPVLDHNGDPIQLQGGGDQDDDIGFRASGLLRIFTEGDYAFRTRSDDGTKLWIDPDGGGFQVVVDNDYRQGFTGRSGTIHLTPGYHPIAFGYYERGGGAGFDMHWDPAGGSNWQAIPAGNLIDTQGIIRVQAGASLSTGGFQGLNRLEMNADVMTTGAVTSSTKELVMAAGTTLDLVEGNLVVDYPDGGPNPFDDVEAKVIEGYNAAGGIGNFWKGTGITSSAAAAQPQSLTALAVLDNSDPDIKLGGLADLEGLPVDLSSVLVKYTYYGDANLDGVVDSNDYDMIDNAWILWTTQGTVPDGGFRWGVGDFNYDGTIDSNDYDKIDNSFLLQSGGLGGNAGGPVPTPEPASVVLLGLGAAAVLVARKRRTR